MSRRKLQKLGTFFGVGDRIRKVRGDLSQEEFGKILGGVAKSTVSRYESGTIPPEDALNKIAEFGNITVGWLLRGDQELPRPEESITIESPAEASPIAEPFVFGGIDIDAMSRISETVEAVLAFRKRRPKPAKFGLLISLLYDQFQKTGRLPDQTAVEEFLRRID